MRRILLGTAALLTLALVGNTASADHYGRGRHVVVHHHHGARRYAPSYGCRTRSYYPRVNYAYPAYRAPLYTSPYSRYAPQPRYSPYSPYLRQSYGGVSVHGRNFGIDIGF